MGRIIILDDMTSRHDWFDMAMGKDNNLIHCYTPDEFYAEIEICWPDAMFLDHDLSETAIMCDPDNIDERTGTDVAKWLASMTADPDAKRCQVVIHSMNPVGAERMFQILKNNEWYTLTKVPFYRLTLYND